MCKDTDSKNLLSQVASLRDSVQGKANKKVSFNFDVSTQRDIEELPAVLNDSVRNTDHAVLEWKVATIYPLVPNRLSFTAHRDDEETLEQITSSPKIFFFSCDLQERYCPFCADFGPVNLSVVMRFVEMMRTKTQDPRLKGRHLAYYCSSEPDILANTAFLLAAYLIIEHHFSVEEACRPFESFKPNPFPAFRDATFASSTFDLSLRDCCNGVVQALRLGWLDPSSFDIDEYDDGDDPLEGDYHQICPKFLAFKGPLSQELVDKELARGALFFPPSKFIPILKRKGVTAVVRLNEAHTYDPAEFEQHGIRHYDLFFEDCTAPSDDLVRRFLDICDAEGMLAVHCRSGLGRTGTMIGMWMMRHYSMSAHETIGWLRVARPGSVIGTQQHYLESKEGQVWRGNVPPCAKRRGEYKSLLPRSRREMAKDDLARTRRGMQVVAKTLPA
eukprot:CAMPEP_0181302998 /NCGR_PEP_ID=MMETSP1101-20121128/8310_1 /TAXON_ID=46948 /ORGANISM="Rhodomonas abbreviata, Strain Caron Lab Isolate" /LENGTH=443 /DNA_ID=CAMNT_0023408515 /DNA_START=139 /DNA_END=1470 /DNA_ORIENTATION=+